MNKLQAIKANLEDIVQQRSDIERMEAERVNYEDLRKVQVSDSRVMRSNTHDVLIFPAEVNADKKAVSPFLQVMKIPNTPPFLIGLYVFKNGVLESYRDEFDVEVVSHKWCTSRLNLPIHAMSMSALAETQAVDLTRFQKAISKYAVLSPATAPLSGPSEALVSLANSVLAITKGELIQADEAAAGWKQQDSFIVLKANLRSPLVTMTKGDPNAFENGLFQLLQSSGATNIRAGDTLGTFNLEYLGGRYFMLIRVTSSGPLIVVGDREFAIPATMPPSGIMVVPGI